MVRTCTLGFRPGPGPPLKMGPRPGRRQLYGGSGREHPPLSPVLGSSGVRGEGHQPPRPGGARPVLGSAEGQGQASDRPGNRNPAEPSTRPEIWGQSLTSFESQLFQQNRKTSILVSSGCHNKTHRRRSGGGKPRVRWHCGVLMSGLLPARRCCLLKRPSMAERLLCASLRALTSPSGPHPRDLI